MRHFLAFFAALSLCFTTFSLYAQDTPSGEGKTFTLDACVDYALENNNSVKNTELDMQIAAAEVKETRGIGYPQLRGNVELTDYLEQPVTFVPGEFAGQPPGTFVPLSFVPKYNGNANLTLEQLIFDGSYFVGLKAAKTYKELTQKTLERSKVEVVESVSKAYYTVLVNESRIKMVEANIKRLEAFYNETDAMYQAGVVEKVDRDRAEVDYNNALAEKQKLDLLVDLSYDLLKFQMGMPLEEEIVLDETIENITIEMDSVEVDGFDYKSRIEYLEAQTGRMLRELDIKNNKMSYLPKLSAFASAGAIYGNQDLDYFDFSNKWFGNAMIGLRLNFTIFQGTQRQHRVQIAKLELQKVENDIADMENMLNLQVKQSSVALQNSLNDLKTQKRNMELAEEVARVTTVKYKEGVGSNLEVITAESSLKMAQSNYYDAVYNALVAKIELDKALGKLYNEPQKQ